MDPEVKVEMEAVSATAAVAASVTVNQIPLPNTFIFNFLISFYLFTRPFSYHLVKQEEE